MSEGTRLFSCIRVPERLRKPRTRGLTMVTASHREIAGMNMMQDLVTWGGSHIDYYKVGYTLMLQPRELVNEKLTLLRKHDIEPYPRGNTVEVAIRQGCLDSVLAELQGLGIRVIEVASTTLPLTMEQKVKVINKGRDRGFTVFAEVGKKFIGEAGGPQTYLPVSEVIKEMKEYLNAGVFKVLYEFTEIVSLLKEAGGLERFLEIADSVGPDNIMFEVPTSNITAWNQLSHYAALYIEHFGPNVNLGDVDPAHILALETMRLGLSGKDAGKTDAGKVFNI